jgi:hypothetical protein
MAWEAILAMLPPVLIRLLIEKLVAVIVPAAGALLAIVEGLQAAWGTISSIIAAIDKFITFLKAVKGGGAGAQFAAALASAAIVVLDFVANFLIAKLASGLKKLAGKLGGIAKRLMKRKKAAGGRSARKARRNKQKRKGERGPKRKRRGASKPRRRPSRSRPRRGPGRPRGRSGRNRNRRDRSQREKERRLREAKRRLRIARSQIKRVISRGMPQKKAERQIHAIARRNRVNAAISDAVSRLMVTLSVNPKLPAFGFPETTVSSITNELKAQGRSGASLDKWLHQQWVNKIRPILQKANVDLTNVSDSDLGDLGRKKLGSGQSASELAKAEVRNDVTAMGVNKLVSENAAKLPPQVLSGQKFESSALNKYASTLKPTGTPGVFIDPKGRTIVFIPRSVSPEMAATNPDLAKLYQGKTQATGSDFAVAVLKGAEGEKIPAGGTPVLGDVKTKLGEQIAVEPSKETAARMAKGTFTPKPENLVTTSLREEAERNPQRALSGQAYTEGDKVHDDGTKTRVVRRVKNQLSALTVEEAFKKNIAGIVKQLEEAIRRIQKHGGDASGLRMALMTFQALKDGSMDVERIIRVETEPGSWSVAAQSLLEAGASRIRVANNRLYKAVAKLDADGDLIG